jgi:DNA-nicking Smr family endonuclease
MLNLTLDLHGKTHKEAAKEVEASLLSASTTGNFDMTVITGNSDAMKDIVKEVCNKYDFHYAYPVINPGVIHVTHFKL